MSALATIKANQLSGDQKVQLSGTIVATVIKTQSGSLEPGMIYVFPEINWANNQTIRSVRYSIRTTNSNVGLLRWRGSRVSGDYSSAESTAPQLEWKVSSEVSRVLGDDYTVGGGIITPSFQRTAPFNRLELENTSTGLSVMTHRTIIEYREGY
jgi:hypothetical protein